MAKNINYGKEIIDSGNYNWYFNVCMCRYLNL
jgi:hypothetical protein